MHLLDVLKEIDITNKYLQKIMDKNEESNPLDSFYDMLKINIKYVEPAS